MNENIIKSILSEIKTVYNGILIPEPGHNYLSILPHTINEPKLLCDIIYNMIYGNSYNNTFKIVVLTDINNISLVKSLLEYCVDINKCSINDIVKVDMSKNKIKPLTQVYLTDYDTDSNIIQNCKPDIILIGEIDRITSDNISLFNNIISKKETNHRSSIISMDKLIKNDLNGVSNILKNTKIIFKRQQPSFNNLNVTYRAIKLLNDPKTLINDIMTIINKKNRKNKIFKIVVNTNNKDLSTKLYEQYQKMTRLNNITNDNQYLLLSIRGYHINDVDKFMRLYDRSLESIIFTKDKYTNLINSDIKYKSDSGILFTHSSYLTKHKDGINIFNNCDIFINMDDRLVKKKYYRTIIETISNNSYSCANIKSNIIEIKKDIIMQLNRLGKSIFDDSSRRDRYFRLIELINDKKILINKVNNLKTDITEKLEDYYNINIKHKVIHNKDNVMIMIPVPNNSSSSINMNYQYEKSYLKKKLSNDILLEEIELIKKKKGSYSGPIWIGSLDKVEIPGNKIGFIRGSDDLIKICEILHVDKFSRKYKRPNWKEKENRNKNILFLTPIINSMKLSELKQKLNMSVYDRFEYLQPIIV